MKRFIITLTLLAAFTAALCGAAAEGAGASSVALPDLTVKTTPAAEADDTPAPEAEAAETPAADGAEGADMPDATTEAPEEATPAPTDAPEKRFDLWFEEGFGLAIPEDWVSYPVSEADRQAGLRYALGDGSDARFFYICFQSTRLERPEALSAMIDADEALEKTGDLTFGDVPFVAFIDHARNASGCAMLWGGDIVTFLFSPQTDMDYMMTATEIMETFKTP